MALNFDAIEAALAQDIADNLAAASTGALSTIPVSSLGFDAQWFGTANVLVPDTSQVQVGNFVKVGAAGAWYRVSEVTPNDSITVEDTYGEGSFPFGGGTTALGNMIWDGSAIVVAAVSATIPAAGDSIRLDSDGQFFFVQSVDGTAITIVGGGLTIPVGTGTTSRAGSSRTTTALPEPPSGESLVPTAGEPFAQAVMDQVVRVIAAAPVEHPNVTVAGLASIASPATGSQVFVTDAAGGSIPAFFDGLAWRRVDTRAVVS